MTESSLSIISLCTCMMHTRYNISFGIIYYNKLYWSNAMETGELIIEPIILDEYVHYCRSSSVFGVFATGERL